MRLTAHYFCLPMDLIEKMETCEETRKEWTHEPWELDSRDLWIHWDALHYFLCGTQQVTDDPLSWAFKGGKELDTPDFGYGPMRVLSHEQLCQVHAALQDVDVESLAAKWDYQVLIDKGIYPDFLWKHATDEDPRKYIEDDFHKLTSYFEAAANFKGLADRGNLGMLLWIRAT